MNFTALELSHKEKIDSYLNTQRIETSELTFTTLFIWRKAFQVRFAEAHGCLVLCFQDNGYPPSLRYPLGGGDKKAALYEACRYFARQGLTPRFYGLTGDMVRELSAYCGERFAVRPMTDYFDYVYEVDKLISLSGKALHSKRNHVNKFKRLYEYNYEPIAPGDGAQIMQSYEEWLVGRDASQDPYHRAEKESIGQILANYGRFGVKGAKLFAGGKLCAFTIGEQLNADTALIHIEKANMETDGAYAAINQMFLEREWSHLTYVNREDDFGLEGLRKAKQSYRPVFMVEKFSAVLKPQYLEDLNKTDEIEQYI